MKAVITTKRLAVWAVELIIQSLLVVLLLALIAHPVDGLRIRDFTVLSLTVLLYFCLMGYALTTALSRVYWDDNRLWTYPAFGALLFWIHFEIFNNLGGSHLLGGAGNRILFILGGMSIAFMTDLLGSFALTHWDASILRKADADEIVGKAD